MATKNISITEEAYVRLAVLRRDRESFSEIIKRITHARNIMQFVGILSKSSADALEKTVTRQRARYNKNLKERITKMRDFMK